MAGRHSCGKGPVACTDHKTTAAKNGTWVHGERRASQAAFLNLLGTSLRYDTWGSGHTT